MPTNKGFGALHESVSAFLDFFRRGWEECFFPMRSE
jgi:hypothetical protein